MASPQVCSRVGSAAASSRRLRCAGQGDGTRITFYERYGFERTGEVAYDEVLLRLKLR